ncbi:MAG: hypothetical protein JEZ11_13125 [Desulfobacterales bacterium]|nr:hypothetical protein [Desulfobacterales bacterium]
MIILLGGEKGGTGKSTMATNLAVMHRVIANGEIILLDADKQATCAAWATIRDSTHLPRIPCVQRFGKTIHIEAQALEEKYGTVIIDCGGRDSVELRSSMLVSDKFYTPLKPSQFDVWTLETLNDLLENARIINPGLNATVFINQANPNPKVAETTDTRAVIQDFEHLRLSPVTIRERIAFRKAGRDGMAVIENKPVDRKALDETLQLYKEVFDGPE